MYEEYRGHDIAVYAGYLCDDKELLACASGGVATALARHMILNGGYVAGVTYSDDFMEARYEISQSLERLDKFKGSKYIEVNKHNVYNEVKHLLDAGEAVLFFGVPCVVAALRTFLKTDYEKLIAVELICHGPTAGKVHRQYVEYLQKQYQSKIVEFSVKRKKETWTPGYLYAKFANGQSFCEKFYHTEYGYAFSVMGGKACYQCKFRGNNRTGDLMIGDFWGATEADIFWNPKGVSAVLVHTEKGRSFLSRIEDLKLFETTFERVIEKNPNIINPRKRKPETDKFERLMQEHDLFYAVKHSRRLRTRIKSLIKGLLNRK